MNLIENQIYTDQNTAISWSVKYSDFPFNDGGFFQANGNVPSGMYVAYKSVYLNNQISGANFYLAGTPSQLGNFSFYINNENGTTISPVVSGTVFSGQTISSFSTPQKSYLPSTIPFSIYAPYSTSNLPVSLSILNGPANITGNAGGLYKITLSGTEGKVTIAANQSGNSSYIYADQVLTSFNVSKINQRIYDFKIEDQFPSEQSFNIVPPIANSFLPVKVSVESGPASITGNTIYLSGITGNVVLAANQSGNNDYYAAQQVTTSFKVYPRFQQISDFSGIPSFVTPGSVPFLIGLPTSSSNLPVSVSITGGPASISGNQITLSGTEGTVYLLAQQTGTVDYFAAQSISTSFDVHKIAQYIFFDEPTDQTPGSGSVTINIKSSGASNNPVIFTAGGAVSSITGSTIYLNGQTGVVSFTGNQNGNASYYSAPQITGSFNVIYKQQDITNFKQIKDCYVDSLPFYVEPPTTSSNLPVTITVTGPASVVSGNIIVPNGQTGYVLLTAIQNGDSNYSASPSISTSFKIKKHDQFIDSFQQINYIYTDSNPFNISLPTASSNLPVNIDILSGPASISNGNLITLSGVTGIITLVATQTGNSIYYPANPVYGSFSVSKLNQYISDFPIQDQLVTTNNFTIVPPISTSSLPVTLAIKSGEASLSDNVVTLSGKEGIVLISANQSGNTRYYPAKEVISSFRVVNKSYNFNLKTNNFFYNQFDLRSLTGTILTTGIPEGLNFDVNSSSIYGASRYFGNFNSYIFQSGISTGTIGINFSISYPTNTGYLYTFGNDFGYNESYVPIGFNSTIIDQIFAASTYNLSTADQYAYVETITYVPPVIPPPAASPLLSNTNPYTFIIKNNSQEDCINDFNFTSTLTGNFSGYLDNNFGFVYEGGTPGTVAKSAVITSGYSIGLYVPYIMPSGCVSMIFAGGNYGLAILNNGHIVGWGNNDYNQAYGGINLTGQCPF